MERFLLLWDELDELVGFGRHFATALAHSVTHRMRRSRLSATSPTRAPSEA